MIRRHCAARLFVSLCRHPRESGDPDATSDWIPDQVGNDEEERIEKSTAK